MRAQSEKLFTEKNLHNLDESTQLSCKNLQTF